MFCNYCGNRIDKKATVCTYCDNEVTNHYSSAKNKTIWKKILFYLTITILLLAIGGVVFGVMKGKTIKEAAFDLLFWQKTPKELYFQSEFHSIQNDLAKWEKFFGDDWKLHEHILAHPYENKTELTGNFDLKGDFGFSNSELEMLKLIVQGSKIVMNTTQDIEEKKTHLNTSVLINGSSLIGAELYQSQDQTGAKVPLINDKFYFLNHNDYTTFKENKFDFLPTNSFINIADVQSKVIIKKKEFMNLLSTYAKFFDSHLADEQFTLKNDVSFKGNQYRKITISLTEQELTNLIVAFLKELEQDEVLMRLFLLQMDIQPNYGEKEYQKTFKELQTYIQNNVRFPDGLKMEIVIDDDEYIVGRIVNLSISENETDQGVRLSYGSSSFSKDNKNHSDKSLKISNINSTTDGLVMSWQLESEGTSNENIKLFVTTTAVESGTETFNLNLTVDGTIKKDNEETDIQSTFTLEMNGDGMIEIPPVKGYFNRKINQNLKRNYSNNNIDLGFSFNLDTEMEESVTINLNILSETTFSEEVAFPSFTETNSIDLGKMSPEEFQQLMNKIEAEVTSLLFNFGF